MSNCPLPAPQSPKAHSSTSNESIKEAAEAGCLCLLARSTGRWQIMRAAHRLTKERSEGCACASASARCYSPATRRQLSCHSMHTRAGNHTLPEDRGQL